MKAKIKIIPNCLTVARMIGSIFILFLKPISTAFIIVYILCGITDILDGLFARQFDAVSKQGAELDSFADAIFIFASLIRLIPLFHFPFWIWIWCIGIAVIKFCTLYENCRKNKCFGFTSNWANKIAGVSLFLTPLLCMLISIQTVACIVGIITTFAAVYEFGKVVKLWMN